MRPTRASLIAMVFLMASSLAFCQDEAGVNKAAEQEAVKQNATEQMEAEEKAAERVEVVEVVELFAAPAVPKVVDLKAVEAAGDKAAREAQEPPAFMKPLLNAELSFIHRVCDPDEEQMKSIIGAAKEAYAGMGDIVDGNRNNQFRIAGAIMMMGPNNETLSEHPLKRIRNEAAAFLPLLLSDTQYKSYVKEAALRDRLERETAMDFVVAMMDTKLVFSEAQKAKVHAHLMKRWTSVDLAWLQNYAYNPEYVPSIPSNLLGSVLTSKQQATWSSYQQVSFGMNFGQDDGMDLGENWIP